MCKAISSPSGIRMADFLWFRGDLGPGHVLNHARADRTCVYLYAIINIFPLSSGHVWLELIYNCKLHQTVSIHIQIYHVQLCMHALCQVSYKWFSYIFLFDFKILNIRHAYRNMFANNILFYCLFVTQFVTDLEQYQICFIIKVLSLCIWGV